MTTQHEYSATAKGFHWVTVGLLVVQFILGWIMPEIHRGMQPGSLMDLHMSLGFLICAVVLMRLVWRTAVEGPQSDASLPWWQQKSAEAMHWLLYGLIFANVLAGWAYASARGWPITAFWVVPLPAIFAQGSSVGRAIGGLHQGLTYVLLGTIGLHVGAALVHLAIWRDRTMQRMLPRFSGPG